MLTKVCNQIVQPIPFRQVVTAGHERKIIPVDNQEFRYLRFRAIGNMEVSGANGNFDGFPYEHFEDPRTGFGFKSFIGKRAHAEHNSALGLAGSIGDLPDAFLNNFIYPKAITSAASWQDLLKPEDQETRASLLQYPTQKDGAIEVLMRIDTNLVKSASHDKKTKHLLERIIRMIDTGQKLACSMGTNIMHSDCSVCGNRAKFSYDYCDHLQPRSKGGIFIVSANQIRDNLDSGRMRAEWLKHVVTSSFDVDEVIKGSSNKGVAIRAAELNHELSFFELSVVGTPAYTKADQLEKIARLQGEDKKEYIRRMASEFGEDAVIDLYEVLQEMNLISSGCEVR